MRVALVGYAKPSSPAGEYLPSPQISELSASAPPSKLFFKLSERPLLAGRESRTYRLRTVTTPKTTVGRRYPPSTAAALE